MSVLQRTVARPTHGLPDIVRHYVERNVPPAVLNAPRVRFSELGEMQLRPGRWSPFLAEQEMHADRLEFAWHANFRTAPLVSLRVRDWYRAGAAGLDVRLWGIPLVRASGEDVARGEAMRYLAELVWVPQAFVSNRALEWREVDESSVDVATRVGRVRVAVTLRFDEAGDIAAMSAERPRRVGKQVIDTPWSGAFGNYRELDGVRLPTTGEVAWLLPDGLFTYFRCTLTAWSATGDTIAGST
jgi:hypothetical protein